MNFARSCTGRGSPRGLRLRAASWRARRAAFRRAPPAIRLPLRELRAAAPLPPNVAVICLRIAALSSATSLARATTIAEGAGALTRSARWPGRAAIVTMVLCRAARVPPLERRHDYPGGADGRGAGGKGRGLVACEACLQVFDLTPQLACIGLHSLDAGGQLTWKH